MNLKPYNKEHNYIGNRDWQYKITGTFYKQCSAINYSAYVHDDLYIFIYREKYLFNQILLKVLFDLIFLFMSFFRSLRNLQFKGMFLTPILYLFLLLNTPHYIYNLRKK